MLTSTMLRILETKIIGRSYESRGVFLYLSKLGGVHEKAKIFGLFMDVPKFSKFLYGHLLIYIMYDIMLLKI